MKVNNWNVFILLRRLIFNMKNLVFHKINQHFLTSYHYQVFQDDFESDPIILEVDLIRYLLYKYNFN